MNEYKLLLVPGDGIGPEVMDATMRVVGWFGQKGLAYKTDEALLGGVAIDAVGRVMMSLSVMTFASRARASVT